MHLILDCLGAMLDVTRFIVSLYFATLTTAALVAAMAGCSVIGEGNEPWDTDIPESEVFNAADGTGGRMVSRLRSSTSQKPLVLSLASRISFGLRILKRTRVARSRPVV